MKKSNISFALWIGLSLVSAVAPAWASSYYIDFAAGSDANNGTSLSTPWKRAPGMTGVAGTAAGTPLQPGDRLVFKGGVTWTASFPWTFKGGSSAGPVTYTSDPSWFSGASYSQPTFDDGHANPGTIGMANALNTGYITINDLKFINCGTAYVANSNTALVFENTHDITITNSTFATESWITLYFFFTTAGSYSNFIWTGNDFSHTSGAVWFAPAASNATMHHVTYSSNTFHDFSSQIGGGVHGDGALHYYSYPYNDRTQYVDDFEFCNNRFYGDFRRGFGTDGSMTALLYATEGFNGVICNNDFSYSPGGDGVNNIFQSLIYLIADYGHVMNVGIYNNSLAAIGTNAVSSVIEVQVAGPGSRIDIKNNIISAPTYCMDIGSAEAVAAVTSDYNLLNCSSGYSRANGWRSYAQWQALGFDQHGVLGSDPLWVGAPGNENLNAASPVIEAGVNLSSLGIPALNFDKSGAARPTSGAWDIGAYEFCESGSCGVPPPPPLSNLPPAVVIPVKVYPNPWRSDRHRNSPGITFDNLPADATVKIFTVSGHEARSLPASGKVAWLLDNESGDKVASGIYLYMITTPDGQPVRGKVVVLK